MIERWLIALTGPRGVVMALFQGFSGKKADGGRHSRWRCAGSLVFIIVLATVIIHGFTLAPLARCLGLPGPEGPGLLIVSGSALLVALTQALEREGVDTLITETNQQHLFKGRETDLWTYYGNIVGEGAEHQVEFIGYPTVLAASDNDAYNMLVASDMGPKLGREAVWQLNRVRDEARHALPAQLGGPAFGRSAHV
ncbi:MAG: hypothetical protein FJX25_09415 [Alphaproteobacteria bacterium]|nr:hypothetical protein [Alphaproteobacteria bacterium]